MLLMIDNYDSFTYNIVQYFLELGEDVQVFRNDGISVAEIGEMAPKRLVISLAPVPLQKRVFLWMRSVPTPEKFRSWECVWGIRP